jgi:hypothetical protein
MGTIQKNSDWESKPTVKKGNIGERLVREHLESKGYIVYEPQTVGAHGFDKLAIRNKRQAIIAECKAKARRTKYEDTGINIKHLEEYEYIGKKYNLPVYIYFIDEMQGKIYGNTLEELLVPRTIGGHKYPWRWPDGIIYFPLVNMIDVCEIKAEDVKALKDNSTRSHEYAEA